MSWVPTPCDALRLAVFSAARRPYFRAENEALEMFIPHADDRSRSLQDVLALEQNASVCRNCIGTVGTAVETVVEAVVIYIETVSLVFQGFRS